MVDTVVIAHSDSDCRLTVVHYNTCNNEVILGSMHGDAPFECNAGSIPRDKPSDINTATRQGLPMARFVLVEKFQNYLPGRRYGTIVAYLFCAYCRCMHQWEFHHEVK